MSVSLHSCCLMVLFCVVSIERSPHCILERTRKGICCDSFTDPIDSYEHQKWTLTSSIQTICDSVFKHLQTREFWNSEPDIAWQSDSHPDGKGPVWYLPSTHRLCMLGPLRNIWTLVSSIGRSKPQIAELESQVDWFWIVVQLCSNEDFINKVTGEQIEVRWTQPIDGCHVKIQPRQGICPRQITWNPSLSVMKTWNLIDL